MRLNLLEGDWVTLCILILRHIFHFTTSNRSSGCWTILITLSLWHKSRLRPQNFRANLICVGYMKIWLFLRPNANPSIDLNYWIGIWTANLVYSSSYNASNFTKLRFDAVALRGGTQLSLVNLLVTSGETWVNRWAFIFRLFLKFDAHSYYSDRTFNYYIFLSFNRIFFARAL